MELNRAVWSWGRGLRAREGAPWLSLYAGRRHVAFPPGRKRAVSDQWGVSGVWRGRAWYVLRLSLRSKRAL